MNFLSPIYYDVADITDDMPNKPLLTELYEEMNAQNERLWMFFEEIDEDPDHVAMKEVFVKPRQHRPKYQKRKAAAAANRRAIEKEEDERGYKEFLKDEGFDDLLGTTPAKRGGYQKRQNSTNQSLFTAKR
tara:strand:+ start:1997 stop:2389 length:393 start_codon:yes stop_codon:yes gene_type:complete